MKKLTVVVIVLVLVVIGASCSRGGSVARSRWNIGATKSFTDELTFNDKGRSFSQVAMEIDINLSGGTLAWEAYSPNGDLLFSDSTQGKYKDKVYLEPVPGQWRLAIVATDVVGDIEFLWRGNK